MFSIILDPCGKLFLFKEDTLPSWFEVWNLAIAGKLIEHALGKAKKLARIFHVQYFLGRVERIFYRFETLFDNVRVNLFQFVYFHFP